MSVGLWLWALEETHHPQKAPHFPSSPLPAQAEHSCYFSGNTSPNSSALTLLTLPQTSPAQHLGTFSMFSAQNTVSPFCILRFCPSFKSQSSCTFFMWYFLFSWFLYLLSILLIWLLVLQNIILCCYKEIICIFLLNYRVGFSKRYLRLLCLFQSSINA